MKETSCCCGCKIMLIIVATFHFFFRERRLDRSSLPLITTVPKQIIQVTSQFELIYSNDCSTSVLKEELKLA